MSAGDAVLPVLTDVELVDEARPARVVGSQAEFTGRVWSVVRERVDLGAGSEVVRDVVRHPGAVGVVALDDHDRLVVVRQYRHPVGAYLWELPAGLCDVAGEPALTTAQRELAEEAGVQAEHWSSLLDLHPTAGGSDELIRLFLATGLSAAPPPDGYAPSGEELDLRPALVPLASAVDAVLAGRLRNGALVAGVLAAAAARARG